MIIGIDGSRAFLKKRTGIEEYSYQTIKHLVEPRQCLGSTEVVLYLRAGQQVDFSLPKNWKIKIINFPYLWTQAGLSLELLLHPVDVLFVPAHTVPVIHPRKTVVTMHGLEYEFCPGAYSFFGRLYMRYSIKNSCRWAKKIIAASENTKRDLMRLYGVDDKKIQVIYEGYDIEGKTQNTNNKSQTNYKLQTTNYKPFLLFIGRLEERKNIVGIVDAFETLKERYGIPHQLILAGKPGFGYEKIKDRIGNSNSVKDIVELGFVSEEEKWELLKNAAVFVFPTQYEGFGIPVLEAQSVGCPVVAANNSSIPEVAGGSALLVDPQNAEQIAESIQKLISDEALRNDIINKGYQNVKRFSWDKCAKEVSEILEK